MTRGDTHIAETHTPVRQCVGCRRRQPQSTLLRIAAVDGRPVVDPRRRLPGRGAYVHHRTDCLDRATKRGGLLRALRISVDSKGVAELRQAVLDELARRAAPEPELAGVAGATAIDMTNGTARVSPAGEPEGRPEGREVRPIDGLTQPEPRFVVGTPQSKDQG